MRREKSKLAGGVEMFSLVELNIHQGKSEMGVVTSARMLKYHGRLVTDLNKMTLAGEILKRISLASEGATSEEFFRITRESLTGLDDGIDERVVEAWFVMNLLETSGDEVNLHRDESGEKLAVDKRYDWDAMEKAFLERENGDFGADEIKILRLMVAAELRLVARVKNLDMWIDKILNFVRMLK
ncbi:hypothetical protein IKF57_01710 [Candidatus Saccharibacteria bacterium]|nr:hypothetical protein [Candidatus Saccharibacteria bacterium]